MNLLWVFLGGGLGALARYGVASFFPASGTQLPWATLLANFLACIVLGLGLLLVARGQLSRPGQLLLLTGFCGGFSTFSTFAVELLDLVQAGQSTTAVIYLTLSLLVGVGALWLILLLRPELTS